MLLPLHLSGVQVNLFSVTRRSRSDGSHSLTESLSESWLVNVIDVTLVSYDTYGKGEEDEEEDDEKQGLGSTPVVSSLLIKLKNRCDLMMCTLSMIRNIPHGRQRTVSSILMSCSSIYCPDA